MPQGPESERVIVYVGRKTLPELDRLAELSGMSRSEFCRNLIEMTVETDKPVIELGIRFGRLVHAWKQAKGRKARMA